jgi:hypothetical protein
MYHASFATDLSHGSSGSQPCNRRLSMRWALLALMLALLFLPGCNALNPLCGSSRPVPAISSLSPNTLTFAQVQQGFVLTVNGTDFVAASVVIINGKTLSTTVQNSQQLQVTVTTEFISGAGTANVAVNTPSGNSGYLGCTSGGTSSSLTLTIT